ncbi:MAG: asparagine synthase (glutamine-hydrolyzing), partial [Alphaproteobacteria bacterium]
MIKVLQPRGPDGEGREVAADGRLLLAHRRLSIIDLSDAASQPMTTADGRYSIVFNGEIYNYRELRAELATNGVSFRTESDTEVLLQLYAKFGEAMVDRLRGMFAFAIWDGPKQRLFMARDPNGIKPLYISDDGGTLRFSSQVRSLLAGGGVDTSPEPAGHVGFFTWGYVPEPYTLYRGIRMLPPGSTLWVDRSGRRASHKWFDLAAVLGEAEPAPFDRAQFAEAVRDSVRAHFVSDVPIGMFLSAGLDSVTLAALATEIDVGEVRCITMGFDEYRGTASDETALAESVAHHYGLQHESRWIGRADFETDADRLFAAMDQPSIDGLNTYFIARSAQAAGLKVALSGVGGDELFEGYPSSGEIRRLVG